MASGRFEAESVAARAVGSQDPVDRIRLRLVPAGDPLNLLAGLKNHFFAVERTEVLPYDPSVATEVVLKSVVIRESTPIPAPMADALDGEKPAAPAPPTSRFLEHVVPEDLSVPGMRALLRRAGAEEPPTTAARPEVLEAVMVLLGPPI